MRLLVLAIRLRVLLCSMNCYILLFVLMTRKRLWFVRLTTAVAMLMPLVDVLRSILTLLGWVFPGGAKVMVIGVLMVVCLMVVRLFGVGWMLGARFRQILLWVE